MKKKILIAALVLCAVALGFLRDYIFVSINRFIEAGSDVEGRLTLLKWVLTGLFCLLYLLNTGVLLFLLFEKRKYVEIAILFYAALLLVSLIAALYGYLIASIQSVYPFIRAVLGVAQSPVVMMVLVAAGFLGIKKR